jgi:hypothetical protein
MESRSGLGRCESRFTRPARAALPPPLYAGADSGLDRRSPRTCPGLGRASTRDTGRVRLLPARPSRSAVFPNKGGDVVNKLPRGLERRPGLRAWGPSPVPYPGRPGVGLGRNRAGSGDETLALGSCGSAAKTQGHPWRPQPGSARAPHPRSGHPDPARPGPTRSDPIRPGSAVPLRVPDLRTQFSPGRGFRAPRGRTHLAGLRVAALRVPRSSRCCPGRGGSWPAVRTAARSLSVPPGPARSRPARWLQRGSAPRRAPALAC